MSKVQEALIKRFESNRIIFWYDEKKELTEQFQELSIEGVEKIQVDGNEFFIKNLINKQKPKDVPVKYEGPKPANEENWLLDIELALPYIPYRPGSMPFKKLDYYTTSKN